MGIESRTDNSWIITYSGKQFWPFDPRPEDVLFIDVAHALSNMCRFNGHSHEYFSVAQHSLIVASYVRKETNDPMMELAALFHDAHEAYLPDFLRPLKSMFYIMRSSLGTPDSFESVRESLQRLDRCIAKAFGFDPNRFDSPVIKKYDNAVLMTERRDLLASSNIPWAIKEEPITETIIACAPGAAKAAFIARYQRLKREIEQGNEPATI